MPAKTPIKAILFDKDGTLFDFQNTWSVWAHGAIVYLSAGDRDLAKALGAAMHFDFETKTLKPSSPIIALTASQVEDIILEVLPVEQADLARIYMKKSALEVPIVPVVDLRKCLGELTDLGMVLGVMTNDTYECAQEHLTRAGVLDMFAFVAGFDSGFGQKPDPAPLLAFASTQKVLPETVVMVGDSVHDLTAGRAAGMRTIGVLTGVAEMRDLGPYADVVLPDIGHITNWLLSNN